MTPNESTDAGLSSTRIGLSPTLKKAGIASSLALLCLLLLGLSLFTHKIIDTDIPWHLRTGELILETGEMGSIPQYDMYSYTAGGNRWIDMHWLFQVVLAVTHGAFGAYGLSLLFIAVYTSVFLILWRALSLEKKSFAVIAGGNRVCNQIRVNRRISLTTIVVKAIHLARLFIAVLHIFCNVGICHQRQKLFLETVGLVAHARHMNASGAEPGKKIVK